MAYNSQTGRNDAGALIPEEASNAILNELPKFSSATSAFRTVRMGRKQTRLPVLASLPFAYFVNGEPDTDDVDLADRGLKQTTKMQWANKYLNAEEIAVIFPIPDAVADDVEFSITDAAIPLIAEAIAQTMDAAVLFGDNKPSTWGAALAPSAIARAHTVAIGTNDAAHGGFAGDISDLFATVEEDGYDIDVILSSTRNRGRARNLRDADGRRLDEVSASEWYGVPVNYPARGLWTPPVSAIVGQADQGIVGIRQDIQVKVLEEAVIQDQTGAIILNLAQQDSKALRVTFRGAWQVANTIRRDNLNGSTRFPFAVLTDPVAPEDED